MLWLTIFFVVPLGYLAYQSLQSGTIDFGYAFTNTAVGSRLCVGSAEHAKYIGTHFIEIYDSFFLN